MPIPEECAFLQDLFKKHGCGAYDYDQLTINHYLPGQGNLKKKKRKQHSFYIYDIRFFHFKEYLRT